MWNWDEVFKYLVDMCNKHSGYYRLSIGEGAKFKDGPVGEGWGEYNLRCKVIPRYQSRYPDYEFGISGHRKYLWCKRRKGISLNSGDIESFTEEKHTGSAKLLKKPYDWAVNLIKNIEPQSVFEFKKWKRISGSSIKKIAVLRVCSAGTRVINLRNLEYSLDIDKLLLNEISDDEILEILRKYKIRFPNQKAKRIKCLLSFNVISLIQDIEKLSGASLSQERRAREHIMAAINGMGLKTASDFLKDIGFSRYLAVLDSRNLRFLQNVNLVSRHLKPKQLSKRKIYYELEDIENELARRLGITVSELDEKIMTYTGEEGPHKI